MYSCSHKTDLKQTGQFSDLFIDYISQNPALQSLYNLYPDIANFGDIISQRKFDISKRKILADTLFGQYKKTKLSFETVNNLRLIADENTFTVTTGHQLCLFTGPLYFIFKIVTTINLAIKLKESYPDHNFIPVYWMATEDHDFEEINHFYLFNKKYEWSTQQKGAVGRFNTTELADVFKQMTDRLPLFEKAYLEHDNLADATRFLVNELFGEHGLIIIDGDSHSLKSIFTPSIKRDIFENVSIENVNVTSGALEKMGYTSQVKAREINFFYLSEGIRERIVFENGIYKVLNTDIKFSKNELEELIKNKPEKFSPNVLMRPVYQETILPNIAYIGGPGELAYWLQLRRLFESYQITFPVLVPRNFGMLVKKGFSERLKKFKVSVDDLFLGESGLKNAYMIKSGQKLFDSTPYIDRINKLFGEIKLDASSIDITLEGFIEAQNHEGRKILQHVAKKLKKASENKEGESINQLLNIHSKLFPGGVLQERQDNFLNFYLNNSDFIETLLQEFDPLDFRFYIFTEN